MPASPRFSGPASGVESVRQYIAAHGLRPGDRLPAERELATHLGMTRGGLRQALAAAASTGEVWRHVGKGTFVGAPAPSLQGPQALAARLARHSNPVEVIEARALLEPHLAALAALRGTPAGFAELRAVVERGMAARETATSHRHATEFHHVIARLAGNHLLEGLFEAVFEVRNANTWGRLKPTDHSQEPLAHLWEQHEAICVAICLRDARQAEALMRQHIDQLQRAISVQEVRLASDHAVGDPTWTAGLQPRR